MRTHGRILNEWKTFRYAVGRWLIHKGLQTMPKGPTRALIADKLLDVRYEMLDTIARFNSVPPTTSPSSE